MRSFAAGDACLLVDHKGHRYLLRLDPGRDFHYHRGSLSHSEIIGSQDGSIFYSSNGGRLVALSPTYADYVLKMPRGAQVVYPKDSAQLVMWGDVGPGSVVLEAGTGSGALTIALVRAVGVSGRVVSVEQREDHLAHARKRIEEFFGGLPANLELRTGDVAAHVAEVGPDRIVLDLPEPWHMVEPAVGHLAPGGVFACYLPTVPQVQEITAALKTSKRFVEVVTFETLVREWHVTRRSVRPSHQMIGHTGFVTVARKIGSEGEADA